MRSKSGSASLWRDLCDSKGARENQYCLTYLSKITTIESEHLQVAHHQGFVVLTQRRSRNATAEQFPGTKQTLVAFLLRITSLPWNSAFQPLCEHIHQTTKKEAWSISFMMYPNPHTSAQEGRCRASDFGKNWQLIWQLHAWTHVNEYELNWTSQFVHTSRGAGWCCSATV